jgi:hypothetical protein
MSGEGPDTAPDRSILCAPGRRAISSSERNPPAGASTLPGLASDPRHNCDQSTASAPGASGVPRESAPRIVFVCDRCTEQREDPVTGGLGKEAPSSLELWTQQT